jgi:hypothetical protein
MPDRSKGMGQRKCSLWSSRLGFGRATNDPTWKMLLFRNLPEKQAGRLDRNLSRDHGGDEDRHSVIPIYLEITRKYRKKTYLALIKWQTLLSSSDEILFGRLTTPDSIQIDF